MLGKDLADSMLRVSTDVELLELMSDMARNTVDNIESKLAWVSTTASNYREHVGVKELVEKLTVLTKDSGQEVLLLSGLRDLSVLGLNINDLLVCIKDHAPSVFRFHRNTIQAVAINLTVSLTYLRVVRRTAGFSHELNLRLQVHN